MKSIRKYIIETPIDRHTPDVCKMQHNVITVRTSQIPHTTPPGEPKCRCYAETLIPHVYGPGFACIKCGITIRTATNTGRVYCNRPELVSENKYEYE